MGMLETKEQLKQAKISYQAAVAALPYMPDDARPYTLQTAERYAVEIIRLQNTIKELKG